MSVSETDSAFALELFGGLGPISTRKMMGGLCLYRDGVIFSILHRDGSIWLKGSGAFADHLTTAGWTRWTYARDGGKLTSMPYWRLPDALLDDPEAACKLARDALVHLA